MILFGEDQPQARSSSPRFAAIAQSVEKEDRRIAELERTIKLYTPKRSKWAKITGVVGVSGAVATTIAAFSLGPTEGLALVGFPIYIATMILSNTAYSRGLKVDSARDEIRNSLSSRPKRVARLEVIYGQIEQMTEAMSLSRSREELDR